MKKTFVIIIEAFLLILICSCEKSNEDVLKEIKINETINLISSKGFVLEKDTFCFQNTTLKEFVSKIDTFSSNLQIEYSLSIVTIMIADSPPPGYTGEYTHQPDVNYTEYLAILKTDSLIFEFRYSKNGEHYTYPTNIEDSVTLSLIDIRSPRKAKVNNEVAIGDDFNTLFKFYERPQYCYANDILRNEYSYENSRIVFKLESDMFSTNYGKIIGIKMR